MSSVSSAASGSSRTQPVSGARSIQPGRRSRSSGRVVQSTRSRPSARPGSRSSKSRRGSSAQWMSSTSRTTACFTLSPASRRTQAASRRSARDDGVQVSRRVEPEGEAQDVSVVELTEDALRLGLDAVELSQDLGEGAIRDAAAVRRAAPNEHAWCRCRRLQPIARLTHEARLAHACLADDGDELGPFVP